jgi:hypothetical protein
MYSGKTVTKSSLNYETDLDDKLFMYPNKIQYPGNHSLDLNLKLIPFPTASQ